MEGCTGGEYVVDEGTQVAQEWESQGKAAGPELSLVLRLEFQHTEYVSTRLGCQGVPMSTPM